MKLRWLPASRMVIVVLAALGLLAACAGDAGAQATPLSTNQEQPADLFDDTVVRDYHFAFADANWESLLSRLGSDEYVLADLEVDGETYDSVGLRIKGNSSARGSGRKVPLNLTMDATVDDQELEGYDTLNLNSGFLNPTLVREILTLSALRPYMPMPDAAYVRVHDEDEYFGVYTLVEQIERTFLGKWFDTNDGVLFKGDAPDSGFVLDGELDQGPDQFRSNLSWLGEDLASYRRAYELKTEEAGDDGYEKLRELTRVLDAPVSEGGVTDEDFPEAIEEVLDVDSALWYLAGINLFTNFDSYYSMHNYFLYWAEEDERFHILTWDVNESFGVFSVAGIDSSDSAAIAQTDPFLMVSGREASSRPLISRLLSVPQYRADYLAHYRTLLETAFDPAALEERVTAYQDLVGESVRTDPNYLYDYSLFEQNVWEDVRAGGTGRGGRSVPGLLKLVNARYDWLSERDDMQAPDHVLEGHALAPELPTVEDDVTVTLEFSGSDEPTGVELVYRVDGSTPQLLSMSHEGDVWRAAIPKQGNGADVTYYARVEFSDGSSEFYPSANQTQPWTYEVTGVALPVEPPGNLVVNELVADNASGLADEAGENDDWVELYNRGQEPIELAGYHLSDSEEDPWAYALPEVTLGPGEYFLVWCDGDPEQGENHADFGLSKDGESVYLSTQDATVDSVTFEALAADTSYMRVPDGADDWVVCSNPTPLETNECVPPTDVTPTATPITGPSPTPNATGEPPTAAPSTPTPAGAHSVYLPYASP